MNPSLLPYSDPLIYRRPIEKVAPKMLLNTREAAATLSISPRTLARLTADGEIPIVRIGRAVRYDPRALTRWIEENQKSTVEHEPDGAELTPVA